MQLTRRVLVVGGGIGGMAAALCLRRIGIMVELVELDPAWKVYGAGITITGASLRAFDDLGLLDDVRRLGAVSNGLSLFDPNGNLLTKIPGRSAAPIHTSGGILRPVLHGILSEAVRAAGVRVRLGQGLSNITQTVAGVDVAFSDGQSGTFDLLIAADGIYSGVRQLVFPEAPAPRPTGQGCWRLVCPLAPEIDTAAALIVGGPIPLGFIPVSTTQMYMFLLEPVSEPRRLEPEVATARLRALLEGFGGMASSVRECIDAASIVYRPLEANLVPEPWVRGRVVLLGDAAHATTPHLATGAGLAVEDALVLAEELWTRSDIDEALARYVERRYSRCRDVLQLSVAIGEQQLGESNPAAIGALMQRGTELLAAPY